MRTVGKYLWAILIFAAIFASCKQPVEEQLYTVSFDMNGGEGWAPPPETVPSGFPIIIPYADFWLEGRTFDGWNTNPSGTGANYLIGEAFFPTGNITLYASWAIYHTITFEANGSAWGWGNVSAKEGSLVTLPDERNFLYGIMSGFIFGGWNTRADGTGITYQIGDSYVLTGDITLYAIWLPKPGSEGNPFPLDENIWANLRVDVDDDSDGDMVFWHSFDVVSGTTYYVWWNTSYSQGNPGKTFEGYFSACYRDGTDIFAGKAAGWEIPSSFTADRDGTVFIKATTSYRYSYQEYSVVYNANGVRPTYTITFDYNIKGLFHTEQTVVQIGSNPGLPNGGPWAPSGYTFAGWNTSASGTGTNYNVWDYFMPTGDITLYAKWILNSEPTPLTENIWADGEVTYGGSAWYSINVTSGTTYYVWWNGADQGNGTKTLRTSVRAGYRGAYINPGDEANIFGISGGGYTNPQSFTADRNGTVLIRVNSSMGASGTFGVAYSTSNQRPRLVIFNANGGSGAVPSTVSVTAGSSITLPNGNSLTRSGYTFNGWNTNGSGTGTNYPAGSTLPITVDTTLYARWLRNHTVTFNANGGSNAPSAVIVVDGSSTTLPGGNGLSRSDYTFVGWNANAAGTGTDYQPGDSVTPGGDVTYYAKWIINRTVTFNANGGTGAVASQTVMDGTTITIPGGSSLSRVDHTFVGWNTNSAGTGTNYSVGEPYTPSANITLYARWLPMAGITFNVEQIVDGLPIIADITVSRTGNGYTTTRSVSVNAADYETGSISWKIAGVGIYAGQTITGSGASFTLNAGDVRYNTLGIHLLTLTVTKNGQQYQRAIPFTIVP